MNRRGFFRTLALALAWAQTKHVAWVFPAHDTLDIGRINRVLKNAFSDWIAQALNTPGAFYRVDIITMLEGLAQAGKLKQFIERGNTDN